MLAMVEAMAMKLVELNGWLPRNTQVNVQKYIFEECRVVPDLSHLYSTQASVNKNKQTRIRLVVYECGYGMVLKTTSIMPSIRISYVQYL